MYKEKSQEGSISVILAVVFALFFLGMSGFAIWAFAGREDFKNNVDEKIDLAVGVAVQNAESAKDVEFIESEKFPTRNFVGPATYGSLSFDYPKTWSVYADTGSSTVLDVYAHPKVLPGFKSGQPYALRVEILGKSYESVVSSLQRDIEKGILISSAFSAKEVPSVVGIRTDGAIAKDVNGSAIYLPLRDRAIKFSTESPEFVKDFNEIILPSITFVP